MSPTVIVVCLMAIWGGLAVAIGRQHPMTLVPLIVASVVWFGETRGTRWAWAFAAVGILTAGLAVWLATRRAPSRRRHASME